MPPAKTGSDNRSKIAVIKEAHTNKGRRQKYKPPTRIFIIVVIKFIAPAIEAAPAKCKLKIARSTLKSACPNIPDNGG